ncbi:MAG: hypothetical protein Q8K93_22115 [Reyranella sp.]|nr:hypothetical protein [Reyranella sp.]
MADDRPPGMAQKDRLQSWVLILQIDAANSSRRGALRRIAMVNGVLAALNPNEDATLRLTAHGRAHAKRIEIIAALRLAA